MRDVKSTSKRTLQYCDLSVAQRKWVELVQIHFPDISNEITFGQVMKIHEYFLKKREANKKYKIGMPTWLILNNAIRKGVYFFPSASNVSTVVSVDSDEANFRKELSECGVLNTYLHV